MTYRADQIKRDMRRQGITIRELAARMDVTGARVRQVRSEGVTGAVLARDWFEAIRRLGHDFSE